MMSAYANPYVGPIIKLSPSRIEDWSRCRRFFLNGRLLDVPRSDPDAGVFIGLETHRMLHELHAEARCTDDDELDARLEGVPNEHANAIRHHIERHRPQCPDGPSVAWAFHEQSHVYASLRTAVRWVIEARLDALWAHDGILDIRDYKTGRPIETELSEDPATRLQAFVASPIAERHQLRLRLSHENLAPAASGDRDWWEPETEDIDEIQQELNRVATEIAAEVDFQGVQDAFYCGNCSYKSICPDSAAASFAE